MSTALSLAAVLAVALSALPAAAGDSTVLPLPHPLRQGERVILTVTVGVIAKGQEVTMETPEGVIVGTVSPFAVKTGAEAGTYAIAVPSDAIHGDRLTLRLRLTQFDGPPREPTSDEVRAVTLSIIESAPR